MVIICEASILKYNSGLSNGQRPTRTKISFEKKPTGIHLITEKILSDGSYGLKSEYQIVTNISKIFSKFAKEGKCTLRFINPEHDLSIKGKPEEIGKIIAAVSKIAKFPLEKDLMQEKPGNAVQATAYKDEPPPAKKKKLELEKTKLELCSHKEYIQEAHFPTSLKILKISNAVISRIDSRCLRLKNLCHLQINNTQLDHLPDSMDIFPNLSFLDLANNRLTELPRKFFRTLSQKLAHLNLSCNNLEYIGEDISHLKNLETLMIHNNQLRCLPWKLGLLSKLSTLHFGGNKIQILPYTLTARYYNKIDATGLCNDVYSSTFIRKKDSVKTLFEAAALVVLKNGTSLKIGDVPVTVIEHLESAFMCYCGKKLLYAEVSEAIGVRLKHFCRSFEGPSVVPVLAVACSGRCLARFTMSMSN